MDFGLISFRIFGPISLDFRIFSDDLQLFFFKIKLGQFFGLIFGQFQLTESTDFPDEFVHFRINFS